jgi:hypothetical protein
MQFLLLLNQEFFLWTTLLLYSLDTRRICDAHTFIML